MSGSTEVFSVVSSADLGIGRYYLDEDGLQHILLGHRDLRSFVTGIEEAVKSPTHVYRSAYSSTRYQFVSHGVLSAHGHPMNVVVEHELQAGRVITASPKNKISGELIWKSDSGVYASYDSRSDVLYFSHGSSRPAYASDDNGNDRVWLRFFEDDDSPAGLTFFDASKVDPPTRSLLISQTASFLRLEKSEIEDRWLHLVTQR